MQLMRSEHTAWMLWVSFLIAACSMLISFQEFSAAEAMETGSSSRITSADGPEELSSGAIAKREHWWPITEKDPRLCYGATFHLISIVPLPVQDGTCRTTQEHHSRHVPLQSSSCEVECKNFGSSYWKQLDDKARGKGCIQSFIEKVDVKPELQASSMPANLCSSTCTCSLAITIPHIRMPKGRVFKKDVQFSPKVSLERWLKYGLITFSGVQTRSCHPENVAGTLILNLQGLHHAQSDGFDVVYEMVHCPPFLKDKCDMPKCGEKRGHYRRPGCPAPVPVKSLRQASSSQQYDEGLCQTPQQFFENPTFTMLDENGLPYVPLEAYPPGETFDGCPQMTDQEIEECFNSYWNRAPLDAGGQSSGHNGHPGSAQSSAAGQHAQQWQEQSSGPGGQQWESRSGTSSATQPSTETGHGLTQDEIEQMKQQPNWQDSLGTDSIKEQYLYDFM